MSNGTEIMPNSTYILFVFSYGGNMFSRMVHGNANNAFNRWGAKRVKDHKRYLYNLAKKKGVQRDEKMYFIACYTISF